MRFLLLDILRNCQVELICKFSLGISQSKASLRARCRRLRLQLARGRCKLPSRFLCISAFPGYAISLLLLPVFLYAASWSEETLSRMTLEEKIGQLLMAPACPLRGEDHWADWLKIIEKCHVGNAIVKQSDPLSQVRFLNRLQASSKIPLLVSADAEWGLAMRMSDTIAYPRNMTLGAVQNLDLIYEMGLEIGQQARRVGIHMNLAPVADVNNNPANPIIHMRSFGEDPRAVGARVSACVRGLEEGGVMACAKHFPGHGDTSVDSHLALPLIPYDRNRLNRIEFAPFVQAIQEGVSAIMSAHLLVPNIDAVFPASLSYLCLNQILREELGFQGLIVSDALNMWGVASQFSAAEIALFAHKATCDLLLYGDHKNPNVDQILRELIPTAFRALKVAYLSGEIDRAHLDASVLRILKAKERLGLHLNREVPLEGLLEALHTPKAVLLKKRLFQEAVTLVGSLALSPSAAYLSIGNGDVLLGEFSHSFNVDPKTSSCRELFEQLKEFDQVVIALHQANLKEPNFGFSDELLHLIGALSERSILCLFATPYALSLFKNHPSILVGYENDPEAQYAVLNVLSGRHSAPGALPISLTCESQDRKSRNCSAKQY